MTTTGRTRGYAVMPACQSARPVRATRTDEQENNSAEISGAAASEPRERGPGLDPKHEIVISLPSWIWRIRRVAAPIALAALGEID